MTPPCPATRMRRAPATCVSTWVRSSTNTSSQRSTSNACAMATGTCWMVCCSSSGGRRSISGAGACLRQVTARTLTGLISSAPMPFRWFRSIRARGRGVMMASRYGASCSRIVSATWRVSIAGITGCAAAPIMASTRSLPRAWSTLPRPRAVACLLHGQHLLRQG